MKPAWITIAYANFISDNISSTGRSFPCPHIVTVYIWPNHRIFIVTSPCCHRSTLIATKMLSTSCLAVFMMIACIITVAVAVPLQSVVVADNNDNNTPTANQSMSSRDVEDATLGLINVVETSSISSVDTVKDTSLGK